MSIWVVEFVDVTEVRIIKAAFGMKSDACMYALDLVEGLQKPGCIIRELDCDFFCYIHGPGADCLEEFTTVREVKLDPSVNWIFAIDEINRLIEKKDLRVDDPLAEIVLEQWKKYETFTMPNLTKFDLWRLFQNSF